MSILVKENDEISLNFMEMLQVLWKKAWLILFFSILGGVIAFLITSFFVTPSYRTRITVYVNNRVMANQSNSVSSSDLSAAIRLTYTYCAIIRSDLVLNQVAERTGLSLSAAQLRKMLSAESENETEIFELFVTDTDPERAALIANGIADAFPDVIEPIVSGSTATVLDRAQVPEKPFSPNHKRNILLGILAGAFLATAVILVRELLDDTVSSPRNLEILGYPLLAVIPDWGRSIQMAQGYGYGYGAPPRRTSGQKTDVSVRE